MEARTKNAKQFLSEISTGLEALADARADSCDCGQSFQSIADSIPMIADSSPIDGI